MLTQNDLQAIGKIIDNKFDSRLSGIEKRLSSMEINIIKDICNQYMEYGNLTAMFS